MGNLRSLITTPRFSLLYLAWLLLCSAVGSATWQAMHDPEPPRYEITSCHMADGATCPELTVTLTAR